MTTPCSPTTATPQRHDLDPVSPDNPVILTHVTGHFCVVNSVALRDISITAQTPDPPGGAIARDERGEPSGLLIETAAFLANSAMPAQGARPDGRGVCCSPTTNTLPTASPRRTTPASGSSAARVSWMPTGW